MPDTFEPVPARSDDDRSLLPAVCSPPEVCQIVRDNLERIQKVIQVLDLRHRSQPAHGHADRLPDNGGFPNPGVGNALDAVFLLEVSPSLIDTAKMADIFSKGDQLWIALESLVEIGAKDFKPLQDGRIIRITSGNDRNFERRLCRFAVEIRAVTLP